MSFPAYETYKDSGAAWLGAVPGHWQIEKIRHQANLAGEKVDGSGSAANYVGLEHVQSGTGQFVVSFEGMQTEAESTVNTFKTGDVLFGKLRPYLAKAVVAATDGICSSEFLVLRPVSVDPNYLKFCLLFEGFIRTVDASTFGSKMPRVDWTFISQLRLPKPPADEQQAIADYLDTETARIDALIREKEELVRLLGEYRQSVIDDLTTGANLAVAKAETGNIFCPAIPSTWTMVRIGKYARIGNGSTPLKDNPDYWSGGTFPWLNSAVVNQDKVIEGSELVTDEALRACHLPIVQAGAVLVALTGQGKTRGQVTVLRIKATINQHLAYLAADPKAFDADYLFWTLTGMYAALRMVSDGQGGTKGALTCEDLSRFQIPKPSLAEQQAIVVQVKTETARIDDLIVHAKAEITLLKELRAATIADAVLGRIDVSAHSATPA